MIDATNENAFVIKKLFLGNCMLYINFKIKFNKKYFLSLDFQMQMHLILQKIFRVAFLC